MAFCTGCGSENPQGAVYCTSCGALLRVATDAPAAPAPQTQAVAPQAPAKPSFIAMLWRSLDTGSRVAGVGARRPCGWAHARADLRTFQEMDQRTGSVTSLPPALPSQQRIDDMCLAARSTNVDGRSSKGRHRRVLTVSSSERPPAPVFLSLAKANQGSCTVARAQIS